VSNRWREADLNEAARAADASREAMPSNEVSMEVGQEDVADFEAKFPSVDKVLVDIAQWVDDNRGRSRLVTE